MRQYQQVELRKLSRPDYFEKCNDSRFELQLASQPANKPNPLTSACRIAFGSWQRQPGSLRCQPASQPPNQ